MKKKFCRFAVLNGTNVAYLLALITLCAQHIAMAGGNLELAYTFTTIGLILIAIWSFTTLSIIVTRKWKE